MSRITRYRLWIGCVSSSLALTPAWLIILIFASKAHRKAAMLVGGLSTLAAVAGIAVLIVTTPPDAIRLRPGRSVIVLFAGTAWLYAWHVVVLEGPGPAALLAAVFPLAVGLIAAACVRLRVTPWWAAVAAWHPGCVGPLALPLETSAPIIGVAAIVLSIVVAFRRPD